MDTELHKAYKKGCRLAASFQPGVRKALCDFGSAEKGYFK